MNDLGSIPDDAIPASATDRLRADGAGIAAAAALLRAGRLVAFPTETVYGLGADATDPAAVATIFAAKERPRFNPLIAHLAEADAAFAEGVFDAAARSLADAFWPGPLTLVVPASADCRVCDLARAGLPSVALRVPAPELTRALLAQVGRPVAAPSANRSGHVSPTQADHVLADLAEAAARLFSALRQLDGLGAPVIAVAPIPERGLGDAINDRLRRAAAPR